jgi:hypothetical protein
MPLDHTATYTADYFHHIAETQAPEHVSLGGDDFHVDSAEPKTLTQRFEINNRVCGKRMELKLYAEGFLGIAKWRRKKLTDKHVLNLRFLSPKPASEQTIARRTLYTAGGFAAFGLFNWLLAALTPLDRFFVPAALLGALGAAAALFAALYRSHEKTRFHTAAGATPVLTLLGTAETFQRCRAIVPEISRAIEEAQAQNIENRSDYLRLEMREHYRLREHRAISQDACSDATRRILSEFG